MYLFIIINRDSTISSYTNLVNIKDLKDIPDINDPIYITLNLGGNLFIYLPDGTWSQCINYHIYISDLWEIN